MLEGVADAVLHHYMGPRATRARLAPEPDDAVRSASYALAYQEAVRALEAQSASRDGVRSRAGTLLSAGAIVAGFLAPAAGSLTAASAAGGAFFGVACLAALYGSLSSRNWRTSTNVHALLGDYIETEPPASVSEIHRSLAYYMQVDRDANEKELLRRERSVSVAAMAVALETIAWLIAIYS